jgi:hypothetical protein
MSAFTRITDNSFSCTLLDSEIILTRSADGWSVAGPLLSAPVDLDDSETTAAFRLGQTPTRFQERWLQRAGLGIDDEPSDSEIRKLQDQVSADGAVLLDTTTFRSAQLAVKAGPRPLSLLDLSTATNALILFDSVIVQPGVGVWTEPWKGVFGSAFTILDLNRDFIEGTLWSIVAELGRHLNDPDSDEGRSFASAWQDFVGRPDISFNESWNEAQDSPAYWDGVPATYFLEGHFSFKGATSPTRPGDQSLNSFVTIQTIRALFNDNLAALLGIPYVSTSLRSPVYAELLRHKLETQMLADSLLATIGPPMLKEPSRGPYVAELTAPFLLGVVLSRMTTPEDYWDVVKHLRESFRPLRERIAADRNDWEGKSGTYLAHYIKYLQGYMPKGLQVAEQTVAGAAALSASVATGSPIGAGLAKLVIKLAQAFKPAERIHNWYLRRFRPHVHLVVEMAHEAQKLRGAESEIRRLWKASWTRADHDELEALSLARPEAFSRLRNIGPVVN